MVYYKISEAIEMETEERLEQRLHLAKEELIRARSLSDYALLAKATQVAEWPKVVELLNKTPESFANDEGELPNDQKFRFLIHQQMSEEIGIWMKRFEAQAKERGSEINQLRDWRREKPDWFVVLDEQGLGVANAADPNWPRPLEAATFKEYPAVDKALSAVEGIRDVWMIRGAPMVVAIVPVKQEKHVLGVVILGYRLSSGEAKEDKARVGAEVAYFVGGRLNQSSSVDPTQEAILEKKLKKNLFAPGRGSIHFEIGEEQYVGLMAPLPGFASAKGVGLLVMTNLDTARLEAREVLFWIPVIIALGFVVVLGIFLLFFQRFIDPFEGIDQGIMEIINGNLDYWFEAEGKELSNSMAQNLNIMVCLLSGRPLPEDDEVPEGENWAEHRMFIDELNSSEFHTRPIDSTAVVAGEVEGILPEIVRMVKEDEESYRRRLFREYTQALRSTGEPVQGITFEKFSRHLESNAEALRKKYDCTLVRFVIQVKDNKVTLTPVPIN